MLRREPGGYIGTEMSSLIAWVAVDSRGPASLYLASDSRITWGSPNTYWDQGKKLFASSVTPDLFGYCGDVLFPSLFLSQIDSLLANRLLPGKDETPADGHEVLRKMAEQSLAVYPAANRAAFTLLHAMREGQGMTSRFRLWRTDWSATRGWTDSEIELPRESVLMLAAGSGAIVVTKQDDEWRKRLGRTSRSVFSAFCDALASREDPNTGGAPQLVGLYRTGSARLFGVASGGARYICGVAIPESAVVEGAEWRNELFERVDGRSLVLLSGAQRQPRPWR